MIIILFQLAPRMIARDLYPQLLETWQHFSENVELDGINFYYPESLYTPGETPLVLWLKPFMIPDVLQRPVNDHLANFQKPPDYVNVFEYMNNLKKTKKIKNKNKKKKNNNSNCDVMEVDISTEVRKLET